MPTIEVHAIDVDNSDDCNLVYMELAVVVSFKFHCIDVFVCIPFDILNQRHMVSFQTREQDHWCNFCYMIL